MKKLLIFGLLFTVYCLRFLISPVFADESYIISFFGNNLVTGYSFQQLEDLRKARGGTAPIPVTVRITPEGIQQNPNLISQLESYSRDLHLQINYQVDFWHSPDAQERAGMIPELTKITTPGNTITLGVEYHFFYDLSTYPDFVRDILNAGVTAPLISTNFNITNPSGPNGPNGNYMYSLQDTISYLARTCPECLTSMSEIAISNYQDDIGSWINEIHRVREILASAGLGLENKPLKIVEAGPDPNKGSFEERVAKAITLANELTAYFANNPEEFKNLNISGITFLIHDAATGRIAMLVMGPDGQWQILYFFAGMGPVQFRGLLWPQEHHPAPMFRFHQETTGLTSLLDSIINVIIKHNPEETKLIDLTPAFQKLSQAFKPLTPKTLQEKVTFDSLDAEGQSFKYGYIFCGEAEGEPIEQSGSGRVPQQPGLLHWAGKSAFIGQMLSFWQNPNQNPNREENNWQIAPGQQTPPHPACHTDMRGPDVKPHIEESTVESQLTGPASIFATLLGTLEQLLESGLRAIFGRFDVAVEAQGFLQNDYVLVNQADSYGETMRSFLPKTVSQELNETECAITKNPVEIKVGLFDISGGLEAEACSPKGKKMVEGHDETMKFLLPKGLSEQYQSPWQEEVRD